MKRASKKKLLAVYEEIADEFRGLPLFRRDPNTVALHALLAAEGFYRAARSTPQGTLVQPHTQAITVGIKEMLNQVFEVLRGEQGGAALPPEPREDILDEAAVAMHFAWGLGRLESSVRSCVRGRYRCLHRKNKFRFEVVRGFESEGPLSLLTRITEIMVSKKGSTRVSSSPLLVEGPILPGQNFVLPRLADAEARAKWIDDFVEGETRSREASVVPGNLTCGGYSLSTAMKAWGTLTRRAWKRELELALDDAEGLGLPEIVEVVDRREIEGQFSNAGLGEESRRYLDDHSAPAWGIRDIQETPLIVIGDHLLIAPLLFTSAHWEQCTLHNWSKRHSGEYGRVVAHQKRALEQEWATLLRERGWKTGNSRKLRDSTGVVVGDVDSFAYDKPSGSLVILQIKWLLAADSDRERAHSEVQIVDAVDQARRARDFLQRCPEPLRALFGSAAPDGEVKLIQAGALIRGWEAIEPDPSDVVVFAEELARHFFDGWQGALRDFLPGLRDFKRIPESRGAWERSSISW